MSAELNSHEALRSAGVVLPDGARCGAWTWIAITVHFAIVCACAAALTLDRIHPFGTVYQSTIAMAGMSPLALPLYAIFWVRIYARIGRDTSYAAAAIAEALVFMFHVAVILPGYR